MRSSGTAFRRRNTSCRTDRSTNRRPDTEILRTAARLFNRKGFGEVTIDEIMVEARLTHGGFYRHFEGKEDLYADLTVPR